MQVQSSYLFIATYKITPKHPYLLIGAYNQNNSL